METLNNVQRKVKIQPITNIIKPINKRKDMREIYLNIGTWMLYIIGALETIMPLLQATSFILAITISCITLYRILKNKSKDVK